MMDVQEAGQDSAGPRLSPGCGAISSGEDCVRSSSRLKKHSRTVRGRSPQSDVTISQTCKFIRVANAVGLKSARLAQAGVLYIQAKVSYLVVILLCHLRHAQHSEQILRRDCSQLSLQKLPTICCAHSRPPGSAQCQGSALTFGINALAHTLAFEPNWYGRISTNAEPSSMKSALLLPDPWMVIKTLADRAAAMFLHARACHVGPCRLPSDCHRTVTI